MAKDKPVNVELIPDTATGKDRNPLYAEVARLIVGYHEHLKDARIALAWNLAWKADVDGRLCLGKCKKGSDLDRELHGYDFVILLNQEAFATMQPAQRVAILDHELSHAQVKLDDETAEPARDERGRTCYRIKKHDLEEFADVVERNGIYKGDIAAFCKAAVRAKKQPLLEKVNADTGEVTA